MSEAYKKLTIEHVPLNTSGDKTDPSPRAIRAPALKENIEKAMIMKRFSKTSGICPKTGSEPELGRMPRADRQKKTAPKETRQASIEPDPQAND